MAAAGINAVRTYNPITDRGVLDVLWSHGIYVIMTIFYDSGYGDSARQAKANVCAVKSHPAILMWLVENEPNYKYNGADYVADANAVATAVKAADSSRPVAISWGEVPSAGQVSLLAAIDVWGINAYRGSDYNGLFAQYRQVSAKPMFLSEYGAESYSANLGREDQETHATEVGAAARQVWANAAAKGGTCVGGMVFEFADEWWKAGQPWIQDTTSSWRSSSYTDHAMSEEWFGLVELDRTPKAAYHTYAAIGPQTGPSPPPAPPPLGCPAKPGRELPVAIDGYNLLVGGEPLFLKGVAWSPFGSNTSPDWGQGPQ